MVTLLAIGADSVWLRTVLEWAENQGSEVARCGALCDAFETFAGTTGLPSLVLVDADCCDDRSGPAFRALRARLLGVPFIVVYAPASERVARTLPSDAVVAKDAVVELVSARLGGCGSPRRKE